MRTLELRAGVDLTDVAVVKDAIAEFGDRYIHRIFTPAEADYCRQVTGADQQAERFAARFAAKEAVVKLLRPSDARPLWTSIEVRRQPGGWCSIQLSHTAADLALEAGISNISISMSHEGGMAMASASALAQPKKAPLDY